jgi:hypothetical protein
MNHYTITLDSRGKGARIALLYQKQLFRQNADYHNCRKVVMLSPYFSFELACSGYLTIYIIQISIFVSTAIHVLVAQSCMAQPIHVWVLTSNLPQ